MDYQVFISFKNTENSEYTKDRQVSEALYKYLSERGIKTFYSNITLFDFGESAYKEVIDDALDEVSLMIIIGSKKEYLTSKWCKYEWYTYQQNILSNIVKGSIITYLGDMDLADVPTGIRHYQSFKLNETPVESVGNFIVNALHKVEHKSIENVTRLENSKSTSNLDVCEFSKKQASYTILPFHANISV